MPRRLRPLAPLAAPPPSSAQSLGALVAVEPAGRSGVFRPGKARIGNFVTFRVDFYNLETGDPLVGVPAVTLTLTHKGDDPLGAITMPAVSGVTGRYQITHTPDKTGEWRAEIAVAQWDVKLVENFYVLS